MRLRLLRTLTALPLLLALAPAAAGAQTLFALMQQADEAEEAGQHARAAGLYDRMYAVSGGDPVILYVSARAYARAGAADSAFRRMEMAVAAGFPHLDRIADDTVLRPLHADARWAPLLADARARHAARDHALRDELLRLAEQDQKNRQGIAELVTRFGHGSPQADSAEAALAAADAPLQARVREIVRARGWPGRGLVGDDGAHAAWLVVQHMDSAAQRELLPLVQAAAARGDARPADAAYLEDRVRTAQGLPQRYGSQLNAPREPGGKPVPHPIGDEACVDRRRAAMLMEPLADYLRQFGVEYTPPGECR